MEKLINKLQNLLPGVKFISSESFYWSPKQQTIHYVDDDRKANAWTMLHETAHAILDHTSYNTDYELLHLEVAAWEEAKKLGVQFKINIDEDHIQNCLDTYRDWLHQRSTCPSCSSVSFQSSPREYHCHNCHTVWQVSSSRFCRPYRLRQFNKSKRSPEENPQTTFA